MDNQSITWSTNKSTVPVTWQSSTSKSAQLTCTACQWVSAACRLHVLPSLSSSWSPCRTPPLSSCEQRHDDCHTARCNKLLSQGWREDICPPAMSVWLAVDLYQSADGSAVRTWLSCRQPVCLYPRAPACLWQLHHGTDKQTDGLQYHLMPPPTAGT